MSATALRAPLSANVSPASGPGSLRPTLPFISAAINPLPPSPLGRSLPLPPRPTLIVRIAVGPGRQGQPQLGPGNCRCEPGLHLLPHDSPGHAGPEVVLPRGVMRTPRGRTGPRTHTSTLSHAGCAAWHTVTQLVSVRRKAWRSTGVADDRAQTPGMQTAYEERRGTRARTPTRGAHGSKRARTPGAYTIRTDATDALQRRSRMTL